jgi:ADP-ribose pyrophosphatase YjhB (NUDIX family)
MKEYTFEDGSEVDWKQLDTGFDWNNPQNAEMSKESYVDAHKNLVISCHDVLIKYKGGILLIMRDNIPAKDILWPMGGRVLRGVPTEESLKRKIKSECGLDLENIKFLGCARTIFKTDPFGHGKGTDTMNLVYVADGIGELKLDKLHKDPLIVTREKYTSEFREGLHPYIRDFMDKVF